MKKTYTCFLLCLLLCGKFFAQAPGITGPSTVCSTPDSPQAYTATVANAASFSWLVMPSSGVTLSNPNSSVTTISFPEAATAFYTVTCSGSTPSGTITVVEIVHVYEMPTVTFSGNTYLCQGQGSSTILMASPTIEEGSSTISYNWEPSTSVDNPFSPNITATPSVSTTYTLFLSTGYCNYSEQLTVLVGPCYTGIKTLSSENNELSAYPNPNNGSFNIVTDKQEKITVVNELGQLVRSLEALPGVETKITDLPGGIYFILTPTQRKKIIVTKE